MTMKSKVGRLLLAALTLLIAGLVLSACGSSDSDSTEATATSDESAPAETTTEGESTATSYSGPEDKWLTPYEEPVKKPGVAFKVGYLQALGAIPLLATQEQGAKEQVEALGGEMISVDGELDIQKQVAGFEQLLAQDVDAIVGYPLVAKALGPQLAKAEAAGIPVIFTASQPDSSKPLEKGVMSDVIEPLDFEAFETMKALSEREPGASFVTMGLGAPVESLEYLVSREQHWGEEFGLKFEGKIDTKEDNPEAYADAATAILGKYPNANVIVAYNELAALSTATVVQSTGSDALVTGANGVSTEGIEAIKADRLTSVYAIPWHEIGAEMVRGAYNALTNQGLPLPEKVSLRGTLVTADNADEVEPSVEG